MASSSIRLIPALVVTVAVFAASCGAQSATESAAKAERHLAEGRISEATVEYQNAVRLDGQSAPVRHGLAMAYARAGNLAGALSEFVRAADLAPQDARYQVDAAKALLVAGQFEDAATRADTASKLDPKNVMALIVRAGATARMNDIDSAVISVERAIALSPDRSASYIDLATLRAGAGKPEEAEAGFRQAIRLDPRSARGHVALASFYWSIGRRADSEQALRDGIAAEPANVAANKALAALYLLTGRPLEAEGPLKSMATHTSSPEAKLNLADYYVSRKRTAEAREILTGLLPRDDSRAAAQVRLAGIEYEAGKREDAYRLVDELLKNEPRNAQVMVIKGRWLLGEKQLAAAQATAEQALKADPASAAAASLRADALLSMNRTSDAILAYADALRLNPQDTSVKLALARLNLQIGKLDAALQAAQTAVTEDPASGEARVVLARVLIAHDRIDQAELELRPVVAASPTAPAVRVLTAEIQRRRGRMAEAKTGFGQALTADAESTEALAGLVSIALSERRPDEARRLIERRLAVNPDDVNLLLLAGHTFAGINDIERAEASFRRAIDVAPAMMAPYHELGKLYYRHKRLAEALQTYEHRISQKPDDIGAHTMTGTIMLAQGNMPEARRRFEKVLEIDPQAAVANNNLAYMDADAGKNLDVALGRAQIAKAALPDDPEVNDTLGWVYYKRDLPALAVPPLEQAVQLAPTNAITRYHLGLAYVKSGDKAKARATLEQALKLNLPGPEAAEARKALATLGRE